AHRRRPAAAPPGSWSWQTHGKAGSALGARDRAVLTWLASASVSVVARAAFPGACAPPPRAARHGAARTAEPPPPVAPAPPTPARLGRSRHTARVGSMMMRQEVLGLERRHAARAGRCDRLPVLLVLHVAGREHARHRGLGRTGRREHVALVIGLELTAEERGV